MKKVPVTVIREATLPQPPPTPPIEVTLDLLAKNIELIRTLPPDDLRNYGILANAIVAGINHALMAQRQEDKLLDIKEAAIRLGMSEDYLYRHFRSLPFAVPMGRSKRFSAQGIEAYLARKQG